MLSFESLIAPTLIAFGCLLLRELQIDTHEIANAADLIFVRYRL
jgi:hypothetical protein